MDNECKAIGLRRERDWMAGFVRLVNPAPSLKRWGWLILVVATVGSYALGMFAGVQVGYRMGIDENPGRVLSRDIADIYSQSMKAE